MSTDRASLLTNSAPFAGRTNPTIDLEAGIQQPQEQSILKQSSHPVALIFHVLFRIAALLVYLMGWWLTDNFVLIFVLVVLLVAFDFWTVKNVTGRLLVGLRYWNESKEDGTNVWVFESREPTRPLNPTDSRIFWTALYVSPILWTVFAIVSIIKFNPQWLALVAVSLTLSTVNLVGYMKCDRDAKAKWSGYAADAMGGGGGFVGSMFRKGMTNVMFGNSGSSGAGNNGR